MTPTKLLVPATLAALLQAGCAGPAASPKQDAAFGDAVRQAVALQTLNPAAGRESEVPAALDAQAARNALVRQRDSFKSPPPTFSVIGITGGGAGGGQ